MRTCRMWLRSSRTQSETFTEVLFSSVVVISTLYISVAIATVGTRAYAAGGSVAPFAAILSNALGVYGGVATGVLAVFIIFGTVNAYTTGMSRVVYSLAKEGGLPKAVARIHPKTGVPPLALAVVSGPSMITLVASYFLNIDLQTALLIPSGAAILVYVIGSASGIRLLKGSRLRLYPWDLSRRFTHHAAVRRSGSSRQSCGCAVRLLLPK